MRVTLESIPEQGRNVPIQLDQGWAAEAARLALEAPPTALTGSLDLSVVAGTLHVEGSVQATAERVCERCTQPVELNISSPNVDLRYVAANPSASRSELRLGRGDLDLGWYYDGQIDLADVLSELLALELPSRIACSDVPACDARVAELLEAAAPEPAENPFSALRDLF